MKARPLRELPGLDDAYARLWEERKDRREGLNLVADAVVPGLKRCTFGILETLAVNLWFEAMEARHALYLVPATKTKPEDLRS